MSWLNLNQSLNSLKGQITTFASEVLSEDPGQVSNHPAGQDDFSTKELLEKCKTQELEIAALKRLNEELEATLQSERLSRKNGVKEEESSWYWDPSPQTTLASTDDNTHLFEVQALQDETSNLKERGTLEIRPDPEQELHRLKEENKNLTTNLEELDTQHQLAMERLLALKKELQSNFEVLKQEHEELKGSNDRLSSERQSLLSKVEERDKEIEALKAGKSDFETLHHKYVNLEKVHSMLRENAEKFQEENQELHEEVFKLQEQVTKLEHEMEVASKHTDKSNMVSREIYEELLKELNALKDRRNTDSLQLDEINIDDNAKSVIENLKREIIDLKHKIPLKPSDDDRRSVKYEKIMQLYNKYVNFELPVDYTGEMPSNEDNVVLHKLENVFKTTNSFKKCIATLEQKLSDKNHNISRLQAQIEDLTAENDFLTTDLQHYESEMNNMKKNNDFLINEIAALKNTSKLQPIIETHEDNLVKLETELDNCNKINRDFESQVKRIEKQLSEVNTEKQVLQDSLTDLKQKYTAMLNELDSVKTQTKAVEDLEHTAETENNDKMNKTMNEMDDLKNKLLAANAKNEQLSIDVHIIENDKVLLMKEIDDLKHALKDTSTAYKDIGSVINSLKQKLQKSQVDLAEAEKQNKHLENEKFTLAEKISVLETEKLNLTVQYDKLTEEQNRLSEILEKTNMKVAQLEEVIEKMTMEATNYKEKQQMLVDENNLIKNNSKSDNKTATLLHETRQELKATLIQIEMLNNEILDLKKENNNLVEKKIEIEAEQSNTDRKINHLEQEFDRLLSDLNEKDTIIDNYKTTIAHNKELITILRNNASDFTDSLDTKNREISNLTNTLKDTTEKLGEANIKNERTYEEINKLLIEKEDVNKQFLNAQEEIATKNVEISKLTSCLQETEKKLKEYESLIDIKNNEIKELNQSIIDFSEQTKLNNGSNTNKNDEYTKLLQDKEAVDKEVIIMTNSLTIKENELTELKAKCDLLENECTNYKNILENAASEKAELINLVNLKHNESLQYHAEIQRLNHVLLEQSNELKKTIEEKEILLKNNTAEICSTCDNLRRTLTEKDQIILTFNEQANDYEKVVSELHNATETVKSLKERCANLDKSLAIQLEIVKRLTADNAKLSEQDQNSTRELERLRHHLVEMEESYTQELMTSEHKLTDCQTRLHQVEERAKQTSTVYTSNSIRANQEVETLRNQIKLLEKQREEVQAKLSEAEDGRSRSEAALTNLQVVLEQFQLDKERDIHAATEKIRNKMEEIKTHNRGLQDEIGRLNKKLEDALAGLQAATRLGDQVETKTAIINDLKEQAELERVEDPLKCHAGFEYYFRYWWSKNVRTLQQSVAAAEERYYNAVSNQQDKVDKNLVKNLVINYVMTAAHSTTNKTQVLRILSTVLDFNQQECERLGLVRAAAPDSLAAEFVKFLQNESKPRAQLPNMMGLAQDPSRSSTPTSRRSSTLGPQPMFDTTPGHTRNASTGSNNLLFQNIEGVETASQISIESDHRNDPSILGMDTGVNQTRNTEGAILKYVLKDM